MTLPELGASCRADAERLRRRGCDGPARLLESCADDLDRVLSTGQDETLTLARAAQESGYTAAHLRYLIGRGTLRDRAETGPARVRRGDLPRKPGLQPGPALDAR